MSTQREQFHAPVISIVPELQFIEDTLGVALLPPTEVARGSLSQPDFGNEYPLRFQFFQRLRGFEEEFTHSEFVSMQRWLDIQNKFASFIIAHRDELANAVGQDPRSQTHLSIYEHIFRFLESGKQLGYILAATGIGKSVLMARILGATGARAIIITPKVDIFESITESLKKFAPHVRWGIVDKDRKEYGADVLITTGQSFLSQAGAKMKDHRPDFIFVDEVDFGATEKRDEALSKFPNTMKIGFTGTDYERKEGMGEKIFDLSLAQAIREGLAAPVLPILVNTSVDISGAANAAGGFDDERLAATIKASNIEHTPAMVYQKLCYRSSTDFNPAICFVATNAQADRVSAEFVKLGIEAVPLHTDVDSKANEQTYERLREGSLPVVVAVRKPVRGVDLPKLCWIFNFTPTTVPSMLAQKIGRITRLSRDNPNKIGVSVDWVYETGPGANEQVLSPMILEDTIAIARAMNEKMATPVVDDDQLNTVAHDLNLDVIVEITELARFAQRKFNKINQQIARIMAPPGWLIVHRDNENFVPMVRIAEQYLDDRGLNKSQYMRSQKVGNLDIAYYFHSDLVDRVRRTFMGQHVVPRGFLNDSELVRMVYGPGKHTTQPKFLKLLHMAENAAKEIHGDDVVLFDTYVSINNKFIVYRSKEVVEQFLRLHNELLRNSQNPHLINMRELARILGRKDDTVVKAIDRRVRNNQMPDPEIFLGYSKQGQISEYYHRKKILAQLADMKVQEVEEDFDRSVWISVNNDLKANYDLEPSTLWRFVKRYKLDEYRPQWFTRMTNTKGRNGVQYIHQELLDFYFYTVGFVMRAYPGCYTMTGLALARQVPAHRIRQAIDQITIADPTFAPTSMTSPGNVFHPYYTPDQVKKIWEVYSLMLSQGRWDSRFEG